MLLQVIHYHLFRPIFMLLQRLFHTPILIVPGLRQYPLFFIFINPSRELLRICINQRMIIRLFINWPILSSMRINVVCFHIIAINDPIAYCMCVLSAIVFKDLSVKMLSEGSIREIARCLMQLAVIIAYLLLCLGWFRFWRQFRLCSIICLRLCTVVNKMFSIKLLLNFFIFPFLFHHRIPIP